VHDNAVEYVEVGVSEHPLDHADSPTVAVIHGCVVGEGKIGDRSAEVIHSATVPLQRTS
jgi:hypothetical protein